MTVLYEVECIGCSKQFFVPPGYEKVTLCRECERFKAEMEHAMRPRVWEQKPVVTHPFWRGVLIAFLFVSPFWALFLFLWLR